VPDAAHSLVQLAGFRDRLEPNRHVPTAPDPPTENSSSPSPRKSSSSSNIASSRVILQSPDGSIQTSGNPTRCSTSTSLTTYSIPPFSSIPKSASPYLSVHKTRRQCVGSHPLHQSGSCTLTGRRFRRFAHRRLLYGNPRSTAAHQRITDDRPPPGRNRLPHQYRLQLSSPNARRRSTPSPEVK
jgi:hypothetical protein